MTDDQLRDEAASRLAARVLACKPNDRAAVQRACQEFAAEWTGFADAAIPLVAAEAAGLHDNGGKA